MNYAIYSYETGSNSDLDWHCEYGGKDAKDAMDKYMYGHHVSEGHYLVLSIEDEPSGRRFTVSRPALLKEGHTSV